jgi:superfamily II DNA/RNA helicase
MGKKTKQKPALDDASELEGLGWASVDEPVMGQGPAVAMGSKDKLPWQRAELGRSFSAFGDDPSEGGLLFVDVLDGSAIDIVRHESGALELAPASSSSSKKQRKEKRPREAPSSQGGEKRTKLAPVEVTAELASAWLELGVTFHPLLRDGLALLGFERPTPIQHAMLRAACEHHRDVVGAAETGSGKTLAFGLPLLQRLLERRAKLLMGVQRQESFKPKRFAHLAVLVLVPTRELALQVTKSLSDVAKLTCCRVVGIVGGMAMPKQQRLLDGHPDVVVATPGRLWDWIRRGHPHLSRLDLLQVLVLDEADRLAMEASKDDLGGILKLCQRHVVEASEDGSVVRLRDGRVEMTDKVLLEMQQHEAAKTGGEAPVELDDSLVTPKATWRRQTMLFSATLGFGEGLAGSKKRASSAVGAYFQSLAKAAGGLSSLSKKERRRIEAQAKRMSDVDALLEQVGVNDKPLVVRIARKTDPFVAPLLESLESSEGGGSWGTGGQALAEEVGEAVILRGKAAVEVQVTSSEETVVPVEAVSSHVTLPTGLLLRRMVCLPDGKELSLYWALSLVSGRAVVFVNTIRAVRHVAQLLQELNLPVQPLFSKMQQRQRLKHLDAFRDAPSGILVATDVAARGLDLPQIAAVIHYHVPSDASTFVHRSGRTARAGHRGLSLSLVSAEDSDKFERILSAIKDASGVPLMAVDNRYELQLQERVTLARRIAEMVNDSGRKSSSQSWLAKVAGDSGFDTSEVSIDSQAKTRKKDDADQRTLRAELRALMLHPLIPRGVSRKYLTSSTLPDTAAITTLGMVASFNPSGVPQLCDGVATLPVREEVLCKKAPASAAASSTGYTSDDEAPLEWSDDEEQTKPAPARSRSGGLIARPIA